MMDHGSGFMRLEAQRAKQISSQRGPSRRARGCVLALMATLVTSLVPVGRARAQSPESLDRSALEHFHNLEVDAARTAIDRAIAAGQNLPAAVRARLLVHRGVIALAGQGNRAQANDDFVAAITLDSTATVDSDLSTPEVQSAFDLARTRVARGATVTAAPVVRPATPATPAAPTTPATPVAQPVVVASVPADAPPEPTITGRIVGDACGATSECGDGLVCDAGICTPPGDDVFVEPTTPTRFFFQFGYGFGGGLARPNMRADTPVAYDQMNKPSAWNGSVNGPYAPPGYTEAQWQNVQLATYGGYVAPGAPGSTGVINASSGCDVDPGEYCVRVQKAGFLPTGGLHIAFGYWITSRIGASMEWRVQTHAGVGTMARLMGSARVHYRITRERLTGLNIDAFVGVGVGQIQLHPKQGHYQGPDLCESGSVAVGERCDSSSNATPSGAYLQHGAEVQRPFIQTGPVSAQLGANINYQFTRSVGAFARPTAYVLVPDFSVAFELTLGGQVAF